MSHNTVESCNLNGIKIVRLLEDELGGMMFAPSTNAVTFFKGRVCEDSLRARIDLITSENPWLQSVLVKSEEICEVVAQYPQKFNKEGSLKNFQFRMHSTLSSTMPYGQLLEEVSDALVPIGVDCVGENVPLWRVTLYEIRPDFDYAIVVSMSHVIGDGHSFYSIYAMLNYEAPITTLTFDRHSSFGSQLLQCVGAPLQEWINSSHFAQGIKNTVEQREAPRVCGYTVNKREVQRLKALVEDGFVSTNDILVSWFARLCGNEFGLMVVNFRNRVEGLTDQHVGNYHKILVYSQDQCSRPESIRQSLPSFNRGGSLPSPEQTLDFNLAMVTNWSAFYSDIDLGNRSSSGSSSNRNGGSRSDDCAASTTTDCCGTKIEGNGGGNCKLVAHFPLLKASHVNFRDCCVVFQRDRETLAVMLFTRSAVDIPSLVATGDPSVRLLETRIV